MKHRFNPDAALYSVLWALLAIFAWQRAGLAAGILLSAGLFPIVMISSMVMLSRTGSFAAEQAVVQRLDQNLEATRFVRETRREV